MSGGGAGPRADAAGERARRWRLVFGADGAGTADVELSLEELAMDRTLAALYDAEKGRGGREGSMPHVPRWLGDVRRCFPKSVVQVMQRDAIDRLGLERMLLEPEMLEAVEPDVRLVSTLLALRGALPARTRETARQVVRRVVEELQRKLDMPTRAAVAGALQRGRWTRRPRPADIDWHRTIRANLRHWQEEHRTVVAETLWGRSRRRSSLRDVVLCIDQSGSMAASIVYSSVFGAVLASMPALSTRLVVFDTNVVDLTDELHDPVELLFSTQLGGGTDINRAVAYCQGLVRSPRDTVLVLISDLHEGGVEAELLRRAAALVASGVQLVVLLALADDGAASWDRELGAKLAALGVPAFACTPDRFPDLMAVALRREDVAAWAARQGIVTARPGEG